MGSSRGNWSARGLCSCWGWECRGEAWGIYSPAGPLANPAVHVNEKYLTNWTKQGAEGQGAILPNGCSGVAAPVVPQCAVPGAFAYFMEKTHGPLAGLLLQSRRDTLGLCTQISFNAEGRNRESTNVISFEERGWCRSQTLHGPERSCAAEGLEGSKGECTKLLHDTCSIAHCLRAVQGQETGRSRRDINLWRAGMFDIAAHPAEWWAALGVAIKEQNQLIQ